LAITEFFFTVCVTVHARSKSLAENSVMGNQLNLEARGRIREPFFHIFIDKNKKYCMWGRNVTINVGLGYEQALVPAMQDEFIAHDQILCHKSIPNAIPFVFVHLEVMKWFLIPFSHFQVELTAVTKFSVTICT
jgi:hypothetical protein